MEEQMARRLVAAEGKKLQQAGLVARTWGNISCRIDENHFVITPSGLDYETMTARDLVLMDIRNGVCCGAHKPSSEKSVHLAAYQTFPEVGYVIHTHQTYATAIGLCGFEQLAMTEEEAEKLGGIARAAYGLSSTEKLAGAVYDAMQSGAKVVFMVHHGVLICGKDREETFSRAMLLEEICKRSILGQPKKKPFHYVGICDTPAVLLCAASGREIPAQVDDMAQMIGRKIPCCLHVRRDMLGLLRKYGAVLVPRVGVVVSAGTADDGRVGNALSGQCGDPALSLCEKVCPAERWGSIRAGGIR